MRNRLLDWFDARTGYKALLHEALDEPIPGGARWRYVFGSALAATFMIQLATGVLLMFSYSPSATTAWGSVFYINHEMTLGWFVRGIHHFGSQAMVVLLAFHLIQVLLAGAYRAPREINWWFGMALMFITLGFSLTGYLLPWDQKGYWATKVATNIAGGAPVLGPYLQKVVVGSLDYGNQTLTRFYGLHVGVLPGLLVLCLAAHVALFRKHGVTAPPKAEGMDRFWPKQMFMDTVASAVVLAVMLGLVFLEGGANLDAPADPGSSNYPARPEWYFLSLFQMLKLFEGDLVLIGTFVIPTAIVVMLLLFPLLDKVLPGRTAHFSACSFVFALVGGATYLTYAALQEDVYNWEFQSQRLEADRARRRALSLAADPEHRIPPEGPSYLLSRDPAFHGRMVLETKCLSCHYYGGKGYISRVISQVKPGDLEKIKTPVVIEGSPRHVATSLMAVADGFTSTGPADRDELYGEAVYRFQGRDARGQRVEAVVSTDGRRVDLATESKQTASDLKGFGTEAWLRGLLEDPASPTYFGQVPRAKGMKRWKKRSKLNADELDAAAAFIIEFVSKLGPEGSIEDLEADDQAKSHPGLAAFKKECKKCHELGLGGEAPNLSGWGSTRWLTHMIQEPGAEDLYSYIDEDKRMPAFADRLSENDLSTLVRYLEGETGEVEPPPAPPDVGKGDDLAVAR